MDIMKFFLFTVFGSFWSRTSSFISSTPLTDFFPSNDKPLVVWNERLSILFRNNDSPSKNYGLQIAMPKVLEVFWNVQSCKTLVFSSTQACFWLTLQNRRTNLISGRTMKGLFLQQATHLIHFCSWPNQLLLLQNGQ